MNILTIYNYMIKAFPKIFTIGTDYIKNIFNDEVEITEKIDGSQFNFGKIDGEVYCRSKGKQLFFENPEKMFKKAIDYIFSIQDLIPNNTVFYSEYLENPHHNTLKYNRTPKNNIILFGVSEKTGSKFINDYNSLKKYAEKLNIEVVPSLFKGRINSADDLKLFLEKESILGDTKIEGVVCKNYIKRFLLGSQLIPIMMGKYVSEKFKEINRESWAKKHSTIGKWEEFKKRFKTEARWQKAIQHLKEKGELENSPRDIGKLMKEISVDISDEEKENIKNFLWKEFGKEILRYSVRGFPKWYKEHLLKKSFK